MESISSFAEDLINQDLQSIDEGKKLRPSLQHLQPEKTPGYKDIQNVVVPNEFMGQLLGEDYTPPQTDVEYSDPEQYADGTDVSIMGNVRAVSPELISEEKIDRLISLLEGLTDRLDEMTTTGSLGINLAGPQPEAPKKSKKKRGYITPTKSDVLKSSISSRVRSMRAR